MSVIFISIRKFCWSNNSPQLSFYCFTYSYATFINYWSDFGVWHLCTYIAYFAIKDFTKHLSLRTSKRIVLTFQYSFSTSVCILIDIVRLPGFELLKICDFPLLLIRTVTFHYKSFSIQTFIIYNTLTHIKTLICSHFKFKTKTTLQEIQNFSIKWSFMKLSLCTSYFHYNFTRDLTYT